ncbi:unnamed protein product [Urochloa decumbens]|uniref:CASP-like protein n=1 Tax=Urochloa decumbens TaxID=240449 RepID=A0ABC8ZYV0_9POAL
MAPWPQKAWVAVGLVTRLLMVAALAFSVQLRLANNYVGDGYHRYRYGNNGGSPELQSYTYAAATAGAAALAAVLLQLPLAVYVLCGGEPRAGFLDASVYADVAASVALASGVGAGFGATNDARRMAEGVLAGDKGDLEAYYDRGAVAVVVLLVGMVLSMCACVASARVRVRAAEATGPHLPI